MTHRLVGASREIYLFCQQRRDMKSIMDRFPLFGEDRLVPFLKMMVDKKVIAEELIKLHIYYHMAKRSMEEIDVLADMWVEDFENNPKKKYISDGNPNVITIKEEHLKYLNESATELEIRTYRLEE